MVLAEKLRSLRHLALDLDGTLYTGDTLFEGAAPFLESLESLGLRRTFVTNNNSRSSEETVAHLQQLGIGAQLGDLYSSTHATIEYLRHAELRVRSLYVLGNDGLREELRAAGFTVMDHASDDEPDAVVVGFDTDLSYERLCRAAYWISRDCLFVATHPDRVCPTHEKTVLVDCGSICAALTHATGRAPDAVPGKPDRRLLEGLAERLGLDCHQMAMVGDRLYTDIAMAQRAGALGILVLSGETQPDDLETSDDVDDVTVTPDLVVADLAELTRVLKQVRGSGEARE